MYELICELGRYEHAEHEIATSIKQMEFDGFGKHPLFEIFVAETESGRIIGVAFFYFGYSTWKGKKLYLDDLIVTESYRRKGIGQLLFDRLVAYALEKDVQQMRWHVLNWNQPAIQFYEKMDTIFDDEWITCKLNRQDLERYEAKLLQKLP